MNAPIQNLKPFSTVRPTVTGSASDVARNLRPSPLGDAGRYASAPLDDHTKLENETRTWVAQTFFGTLLKQMRNSPFKSDLFSGGRGGEAFGSLHDQQLADHMARGAGSKLVNSIVRRLEANAAYRKQSRVASRASREEESRRTPSSRNTQPATRDSSLPASRNPSPRSPHAAPAR